MRESYPDSKDSLALTHLLFYYDVFQALETTYPGCPSFSSAGVTPAEQQRNSGAKTIFFPCQRFAMNNSSTLDDFGTKENIIRKPDNTLFLSAICC